MAKLQRRPARPLDVAMSVFWSRINKTEKCWIWTGGKCKGYGSMMFSGKVRKVHQVAYESANGPVPDGLVIDHLCRNKACCNPDHLEAVTQAENLRRGNRHHPDQCKWGHVYTEQSRDKKGRRLCLVCVAKSREKENKKRRERLYGKSHI